MMDHTLFLGLDVHKKTISVATVDGAAGAEVRFYGTIENTPDALRRLCKKLSKDGRLLHCLLRGRSLWVWRTASTDPAWASL